MALVFAVCLLSVAALAVTIGWDAAPGATGYRVYHGGTSRGYTSVIEAGTNRVQTVTLPAGDNFIAVTAYNSAGESDYSREIWWYVSNSPPVFPSEIVIESSQEVTGPWSGFARIGITNDGAQRFWRFALR